MPLTPKQELELIQLEQEKRRREATAKPSKLATFGKEMLKESPEMIGGLIGEMAGLPAGPLGAMAGGAIGQATPAAAKESAKIPLGPKEQMIMPNIPQPFQGLYALGRGAATPEGRKEIMTEAAIGAGGPLPGIGVSKVAGKVLAPFKSTLIKEGQVLKNVFRRVGGQLSPAQLTDSKLVDFMEELVQGSFAGQASFREFKETQQAGVNKLSRVVAKRFADASGESLSDEGVGELILSALKSGRSTFKAAANTMYRELDDVVKAASVSTLGMKKAAKELLDKISVTKGFAKTPEITDAIKATQSLPDTLPFSHANEIRSSLLTKIRDLAETQGKGQSKAALSKLTDALDTGMEKAGESLSGEAASLWRNTNAFYRKGKETFENDFLANLIIKNKTNPEKIGATLLKKGNVTDIKKFKKALQLARGLDPNLDYAGTMDALRSGYFENLLNRFSDKATGTLNGKAILSELNDRKTLATLKEVFSPEQLNLVKTFAKVADKTQEKTGATGAAVAIKLAQFGAALQLVTAPFQPEKVQGPATAGSVAILFGPSLLAKMMTSPTGIKLLTEGIELGVKGKAATALLPSFLSKLGVEAGQVIDRSSKLNRPK